jgi:hypothetical protein
MVHANWEWQKCSQRKEEAIRNNRGRDADVCTVRLKELGPVVIVIDKSPSALWLTN